ncbi:MAG: MBOAT family protein [Deltaproteobacteria bacterium]|nr:MAG: MBOAT family protein [Deltaproteobacteria bacterium]
MLFNSPTFLVFACAVFSLYALLRQPRARALLLLAASYLFYAGWDYRYLSLLLISTSIDFAAGRALHAEGSERRRRAWLVASLATNLGLLGVFKYGNFLLGNLAGLLGLLGLEAPRLPDEIPIGISFYTFQTISYTIDCYRRRIRPCDSRLEFALYVAFFPQLVAGPIVRAHDLLPQLRRLTALRGSHVAEGLQRFTLGLFKKVVIADNVGLFVDTVFQSPGSYGPITLWCGAYGFALQIYCDFSGYTDMALGLARALGVRLPENFAAPYLSTSITEFWRRWHMSLSSWLRDYLYIPLGGSRGGVRQTYRNLFATMLLGGLWHGAAWTFVLWGAFHGALLAFERALGIRAKTHAEPRSAPLVALRGLLTFHLVCLGWVIFRAPDFAIARAYLAGLFQGPIGWDAGTERGLAWAAALLGLAALQWAARRFDANELWERLHPSLQGATLAAAVLAVSLWHVDEVAFIYFQF